MVFPFSSVLRQVLVLILMLGGLASGQAESERSDEEIVLDRIRRTLTGQVAETKVRGLVDSLVVEGEGEAARAFWPDIDYTSTARTDWPPARHLERLQTLARAWAEDRDSRLLETIHQGLRDWVERDPNSSNWWHTKLNIPQRLAEILVLIENQVGSGLRDQLVALINRAYVPRETNSGAYTGANRVDRAYAVLMVALLDGNADRAEEAVGAIQDTFQVTHGEGIQPDGSFHQHGPMLYLSGYGAIMTNLGCEIMELTANTRYAFSDQQVAVLIDHFLDGVQWFQRGATTDLSSANRGISRSPQSKTAGFYLNAVRRAAQLADGYRQEEINAYLQRLENALHSGQADPAQTLRGHRHFWRSDSSTHHTPSVTYFLRMTSTRTSHPEKGNSEGLTNLHLGDGVTQILHRGNEYDGIMPLWDWYRLPGTTVLQDGHSLEPETNWDRLGESDFVGGVSDGQGGLSAFQYQSGQVRARKVWFFSGERMVALGSDLHSGNSPASLVTTLNQVWHRGEVETHIFQAGTDAPKPAIWHDGLAYVFLDSGGGEPGWSVEKRSGSWQRLNANQSAQEVQGEVFQAEINHGSQVDGGRYAYLVTPLEESAKLVNLDLNQLVIRRNDAEAQVVQDMAGMLTGWCFWEAGETAGMKVEAPCLVLARVFEGGFEISFAEPTGQREDPFEIRIQTTATEVISRDEAVEVLGIQPFVRLRVDPRGSEGRSLRISLRR